jgi:predicted component of type VI protein secretion system
MFASTDSVDGLSGSATRGIGVAEELSPPPVLPTSRGLTYFRFDLGSPLWSEARARGQLAVHLPAGAGGVTLRLYVVTQSAREG